MEGKKIDLHYFNHISIILILSMIKIYREFRADEKIKFIYQGLMDYDYKGNSDFFELIKVHYFAS